MVRWLHGFTWFDGCMDLHGSMVAWIYMVRWLHGFTWFDGDIIKLQSDLQF